MEMLQQRERPLLAHSNSSNSHAASGVLLDSKALLTDTSQYKFAYDYTEFCSWEKGYSEVVQVAAKRDEEECSVNINKALDAVRTGMSAQCAALKVARAEAAGYKNVLRNVAVRLQENEREIAGLKRDLENAHGQEYQKLVETVKILQQEKEEWTKIKETQAAITITEIERVSSEWKEKYELMWNKFQSLLGEYAVANLKIEGAMKTVTAVHVETTKTVESVQASSATSIRTNAGSAQKAGATLQAGLAIQAASGLQASSRKA